MSDYVSFKKLAGDHYHTLDSRTGIGPRIVRNTLGTFSIPSVWNTFDGYLGPKKNKSFSTESSSGAYNSSGKIKTSLNYREPFHSFKYYESLGSMYGIHEIINERELFENDWGEIREQWKSEPIYIDRYDRLRNSSRLSYNNSSNDICALSLIATPNGNNVDFGFDQHIKHDENLKPYIEIHVGEFHLLPNTPRNVYRCNLANDILYIPDGIDMFNSNKDVSAEVLDILPQPIPTESSPIEFHVGICRLTDKSSRPKDFNSKELEARHPNYIEGGAQIRWKSLSDRCLTWVRVYDGTDLKRLLSSDAYRTSHYVLNTKIIIRLDKLKKIILDHKMVDNSTYKILIHPPSYSFLPYDEIDHIKEPTMSMFVNEVSQIRFDVQRNYKSNGSFHYVLNIYDRDRETLLIRDSSSSKYEYYKNDSILDDIKPGKWFIDGKPVNDEGIKFDSAYNYHAINTESYGEVRYVLSDSMAKFIKDKERVYVSIETYDGTRQNNG